MKTIKTILFAAFLFFAAAANAQLLKASMPVADRSMESLSSGNSAALSSSALLANKAGIRAVQNFSTRFSTNASAKWTVETEVISASFKSDDIQTTVVYDLKGRWLRNMKVYNEDKMPRDIRTMVKRSEYFDYKINRVQEFLEGDILFYVVHLEDATSVKQITICNGDINLLSGFKKG